MIQKLINAQDSVEKINEIIDKLNEISPSVDENSIYVNWPKGIELPEDAPPFKEG